MITNKFFILFKSIALVIFLSISFLGSTQVPFHRGVNFTNWFQARSAAQIKFNKFTRKDFENIKSLGCDVVRLPINLHSMTSGKPDYKLDPLFLSYLDQTISWAEELKIHLILDNHSFDPSVNTDPAIGDVLVKVWSQMAKHYKDRSDYIYYEVLNEPHGIADSVWSPIQQRAIDAIRKEDQKHFIIVGPTDWNNYHNLKNMPVYADSKLIYTFHFYDPFIFTHQGASWVTPTLVPLSGVPFPYKKDKMPAIPASLDGAWSGRAMVNYDKEGTAQHVKDLIDMAVDFKNQRHVNIFCGEFGVYIPNSDNADRVEWYKLVCDYMNEKGIPWTIWDYTGTFGLFKKGSKESFDEDLNLPLIEALHFTAPAKK